MKERERVKGEYWKQEKKSNWKRWTRKKERNKGNEYHIHSVYIINTICPYNGAKQWLEAETYCWLGHDGDTDNRKTGYLLWNLPFQNRITAFQSNLNTLKHYKLKHQLLLVEKNNDKYCSWDKLMGCNIFRIISLNFPRFRIKLVFLYSY